MESAESTILPTVVHYHQVNLNRLNKHHNYFQIRVFWLVLDDVQYEFLCLYAIKTFALRYINLPHHPLTKQVVVVPQLHPSNINLKQHVGILFESMPLVFVLRS